MAADTKMCNIIGLSAYYHDSACCLLQDGVLIAAAQEERFTREKHDNALPQRAFRYCLEAGGISIPEIDCIAYYENPVKKLARQIWMAGTCSEARLRQLWQKAKTPMWEIRELLGYEGRIEVFDHHQSHAASSFFYSGFDDAAILTADGVGEWCTMSYGVGREKHIELFEEVHFPDSLGLLYSTITGYLGFSVNDGEYKVMGLAAYGKPAHVEAVRGLLESLPAGQYRLQLEKFDFLSQEAMFSEKLSEHFGHLPRRPGSEVLDFHKDLACSLQQVLEETLLEKVSYLHQSTGLENLCLAGGVALNCVANARIRRESDFKNVFIQPAAGDAGTSLGAAALAYVKVFERRPKQSKLQNACLGPAFSADQVEAILRPMLPALNFKHREEELLRAAAERLAAGKIVGWFQGRMEFGPRALGARSILADPRLPGMRDLINSRIKKREEFRPFAPAVLEERAGQHFDLRHSSPFMLETCAVTSSIDLPAITHVDGSARVQTVDPRVCGRFGRLLECFEHLTGCPVLLNTSFNMRDEPIVCTPVEAVACFLRATIDCLVIEDFIVDRDSLSPSWRELVLPGATGGRDGEHPVYTLV